MNAPVNKGTHQIKKNLASDCHVTQWCSTHTVNVVAGSGERLFVTTNVMRRDCGHDTVDRFLARCQTDPPESVGAGMKVRFSTLVRLYLGQFSRAE